MSGPCQMAADVMMLEKLLQIPEISLLIRFYQWEGTWLSIGKNQRELPRHWINLIKERKLNIVRRPSGGTAVLHTGLTYSLAWLSPPIKKHQAYIAASQWLINCFSKLGLHLQFGNHPHSFISDNCFSTSSSADLVDQNGIKRIGSAQFWKRGNLLQHGEILLDPPKELWEEIFNTDPPKPAPKTVPRVDLERLLTEALISHWSTLKWSHKGLEPNDLKEISENSNSYLVTLSNSDFGINPESIIPSTILNKEIPKG
ncbi:MULTISPECIES: lipoate--protein ligase family protein [Prochlorococcus]|uniref:lipoate--protein ligase family protein n=1 Tax=Prochlorococcus TaxID=1218 RepID=UPI00056610AD|nr:MULTISPECIES: lipoate--protein ligase family protein [Prochlorococcus]